MIFFDFSIAEDGTSLINRNTSSSSIIELLDTDLHLLDQIEIRPAKTIRIVQFNKESLAYSEDNEEYKLYEITNKFGYVGKGKYDLVFKGKESCIVVNYPELDNLGFIGMVINDNIIWRQNIVYKPFFQESFNFFCGFAGIDENWVIQKGNFNCYSLTNGNLLWSESILELGRYYQGKLKFDRKVYEGEVDRFLGIYINVLWVLLKNGMLLGLEVKTGNILHKIDAPKQYPAELFMMEETRELNYYYNHQSIFDVKHGKIIRLWHVGNSDANYDWYFEVDLSVSIPELIISKVDNITKESFIIDGNPCPLWPFDDEYIYVCNYRDYKLALFNRKTRQIDWVHQMEIEPAKKSFITKMEVQGNRWYVLDNSKTLYIYERVA